MLKLLVRSPKIKSNRTSSISQATAMSVDWTGQWALLAGRRHLALQSLDLLDDNGVAGLQKFYRNSKYEVSAAEWAICEGSQEYCAIAASQVGYK